MAAKVRRWFVAKDNEELSGPTARTVSYEGKLMDDPGNEIIDVLHKIHDDWINNGGTFEELLGIIEIWKSMIMVDLHQRLKEPE